MGRGKMSRLLEAICLYHDPTFMTRVVMSDKFNLATSRSAFLIGAASLAGCSSIGVLETTAMPRLASAARRTKSLSQSPSAYQLYSTTPNGYRAMMTSDSTTMAIFDPGGLYVAGGSITGVDSSNLYAYAENNAARFDSMTLSGAAPYNPTLNATYRVDAVTTIVSSTNSSGQTYATASSDVTNTRITAIDSSSTQLDDTASFRSQRVSAGMAIGSGGGTPGGGCGGRLCTKMLEGRLALLTRTIAMRLA